MALNLSNLPYDVQWNIANYIDDIDTKRYFNVFRKIKLDKFQILNRTIRRNVRGEYYNMRCNFHENYEDSGAATICHDLMNIFIKISDTKVRYKLHIYKLKKKPFQTYTNSDDIYYKGPLEEDYYWQQSISIEYSL